MQQIEKNIAFIIESQFPATYRENGPELVKLIEEYYRFIETQENQSHYVSRRLFEYRDVSTTLDNMLIFFQKKYMADLPFNKESIKIVIKNIVELYKRKGTRSGIELFFNAFYQEEVEIYYPAKQMFKPSDSKWKTGIYLQMFPNENTFKSKSGINYNYNDLIGRNIIGTASKAKAAVNKVNFILLNGITTPIIYLDLVKGTFEKFDDVQTVINGEVVNFGRINGSLSGIEIDESLGGTNGNKVGDIYQVTSKAGINATAVVTDVSEEATGQVFYNLVDGGFGYSVENTRLLVSDQVIILNNQDLVVNPGERISNSTGTGIVIGQSESAIGVKTTGDAGLSTFSQNTADVISTIDRGSSNISLQNVVSISAVNNSSPGAMFADTGDTDDVSVTIDNTTSISVITDVIGDFASVRLDSGDYGLSGSGTENINTRLEDAFELTTVEIGRIASLNNINPGSEYINDVFVLAVDDFVSKYKKKDQVLSVVQIPSQLEVGDILLENSSGKRGVVRSLNAVGSSITITPFDYEGFTSIGSSPNITRETGSGGTLTCTSIEVDFGSKSFGENAIVSSRTEFASGRIKSVSILGSGFGYVSGEEVTINDNNTMQAKGIAIAEQQGITRGFWGSLSSQLNGFITEQGDPLNINGKQKYYDGNMKIQDSDFYQEYSYQIKSMLGREEYEQLLKENVHLAGTKMFSEFSFKAKSGSNTKQKFVRVFNDNGVGSPLEES